MEAKLVAAEKPDVHIVLTFDEAETLISMAIKAKAFEIDCGHDYASHDIFIDELERVLHE